jgi:hypothetical protein
VVWNSQGGKWPSLWDDWLGPFAKPAGANPVYEDVIGLVVEAGWAPWVLPGEIRLNAPYFLDSALTFYDGKTAAKSSLCNALGATRNWRAMWIPWVNLDPDDFDKKVNTRCSMAAVSCTRNLNLTGIDRIDLADWGHLRPVVRVGVGIGDDTKLTIFCVHLISGYWGLALHQLGDLTRQMSSWIPEGSMAIIVGDMNIPGPVIAPDGWKLLDANPPNGTQKSGKDLDWALLYDPKKVFKTAQATVLEQWKTGKNKSDHSVMSYVLRDG